MTVRPGRDPTDASASTRAASAPRIFSESAVPSRTCAVILGSGGRFGGGRCGRGTGGEVSTHDRGGAGGFRLPIWGASEISYECRISFHLGLRTCILGTPTLAGSRTWQVWHTACIERGQACAPAR